MMDSSVKTLGNLNMTVEIAYDIKNPSSTEKFEVRSTSNPIVTVYKSVHNKKVFNWNPFGKDRF